MKRTALMAAAAGLLLCACEPQVFTLHMEMRYPSSSGIDLSGKRPVVVYLEDAPGRDSVFSGALSNAFAERLEEDYFGGRQTVPVFRMDKGEGDYASRDTLVNLVLDTGGDVVFLFDAPIFGEVQYGDPSATGIRSADSASVRRAVLPYSVNLYVYDSMNAADSVRTLFGASTARTRVYSAAEAGDEAVEALLWGTLGAQGEATGHKSAEKFSPSWVPENFNFYYFDSDAWTRPAEAAYSFKWHDAMDGWMKLLGSKEPVKRACAEYNLAAVCYILGDYALAESWLDRSDADGKLPSSSSLRSKIQSKKR